MYALWTAIDPLVCIAEQARTRFTDFTFATVVACTVQSDHGRDHFFLALQAIGSHSGILQSAILLHKDFVSARMAPTDRSNHAD